ncbi:fam-g protein [Plasmodium gallinaceum]|uniref:Fam-g protein n=1 Tax=Plasmodium gallinaceum TaxID=5849 RepID=A0A1J1GUS9_PLAGA|nr:fam-g protein [Plasmodium gallinaceum]CRG96057.1 fam-g protein [Plasmodium gallinaceum]
MKAFTLCLKIFTFLILTWIFHCFYNYDSCRSFIDKDTLLINNKLKDKRLLAEGNILEKNQTHIIERKEHYQYGEKDNKNEKLINLKNMYSVYYSAIYLLMCELFFIETNEICSKCKEQMLSFYRSNNSYTKYLEPL